MKVTQISEHVWSLKTWLIIPVHVWLVKDENGGFSLVDAGIPSMAKGISACLKSPGGGPLERILLTHGHSDHVGAIPRLLKDAAPSSLPVYAHRVEIPYMEGDVAYPRRKKAAASVARGLAQPLPEDGDGRPLAIGGLTPLLAPGHSPGHVVYYHERDRVLLAGDLFTSKKGKLRRPMPAFTADMREAVQSSLLLRELDPVHLEVCHGDPVLRPAEQLDGYLRANGYSGTGVERAPAGDHDGRREGRGI